MPLSKSCSVDAFDQNLKELLDGGKPKNQALAIAYQTLRTACGVPDDTTMTPSEIVAKHESQTESVIGEAGNATVGTFLTVFSSLLTQYDRRVSGRERVPNIYRLSHLLGALGQVREQVKGLESQDSREALTTLRAALDGQFTSGNPGDLLRRAVDQYLKDGTMPKIPTQQESQGLRLGQISEYLRAARHLLADTGA